MAKFKNADIDKRPPYYESMSGVAYLGRLDNGMSVGDTTVLVSEILEVDKVLTLGTGTFDVPYDLGYIPQVIAIYWIDRSSPIKQVLSQRVLDVETDIAQLMWQDNIQEGVVTMGYTLSDEGGYGESTVRIKMKIYLLDASAT